MANAQSTAGIQLKYAVEATAAGTRPTTGYTAVTGISSIPAIGEDVNTIDVTPLDETSMKRYIDGLRDNGGAIAMKAFDSSALRTAWTACMTAYSGLTANKGMWFEISIPGLDSFYIPAKPVELGFGGAEVDSALEVTVNICPQGALVQATAST